MNVLMLTPTAFPRCTGNAVTVDRIARLLSRRNIACEILDLSRTSPDALRKRARSAAPDLLHAFHAIKGGVAGLRLRERFGVPLITTLTGTDINLDFADPVKRRVMREVLTRSAAVTVFQETLLPRLHRLGIPEDRIRVIHQSVDFPERGDRDYRAGLGLSDDTPVILMLGGLRQVKQMDYAIAVLKKIRRRHPTFQLLIAGPLLEPEATADLDEALRVHPWIRYLGEVPRHQVPSLIEQTDLVLNTSRSESESNAILEALSFGRIVIARDIPGNAHLGTGAAGLLFRNRQELERQLLAVLEQPEQWAAAGKRARRRIAAFHRPDREMKAYAALYRDVSRASPRARR